MAVREKLLRVRDRTENREDGDDKYFSAHVRADYAGILGIKKAPPKNLGGAFQKRYTLKCSFE